MNTFVASAKSVVGNFWSMGTAVNPSIKKCLDHAKEVISSACRQKIKPEDTALIISKAVAAKICLSHEIHSYLQQQAGEYGIISGHCESPSKESWIIPDPLYGMKVVFDEELPERTAKVLVSSWFFTFTEVYE